MTGLAPVWELKDPQNHRTQFDSEEKTLIYFGPLKEPNVKDDQMRMWNPQLNQWSLLDVDYDACTISGAFSGNVIKTSDGIGLQDLSFYKLGSTVVLYYRPKGTREEERTGYALLIVFAVFLVAWYIATKH